MTRVENLVIVELSKIISTVNGDLCRLTVNGLKPDEVYHKEIVKIKTQIDRAKIIVIALEEDCG